MKLAVSPHERDPDISPWTLFPPDIFPTRTIPPPYLHGVGHFPLPPPQYAPIYLKLYTVIVYKIDSG